jgi:hypothetical protein
MVVEDQKILTGSIDLNADFESESLEVSLRIKDSEDCGAFRPFKSRN